MGWWVGMHGRRRVFKLIKGEMGSLGDWISHEC